MSILEAKQMLQSGSSQDGYLSTTDWNIFNNKQDALTNGVDALTSAEVAQLAKIDTTTIVETQWAILGTANQGIATTDTMLFAQVTVDNLVMNANQLSASTGNLDLKAVSATGLVRILDDGDVPVFSYSNNLDIFTFSDTVTIGIGNILEVNTINKYNAITGVTIEGVALLDGDITLPVNKKINFGDAIDTEFDLLDIDTGEALGLLFQYNRMNSLSGSVQLFRCQNPNAGDRAGFMTESIGSHAENYLTTRANGFGTYSYYGYMQNGIPSSSGGDRRMFEVGMNTTSNTYTIGYGSKAAGQVMVFTDHFKIDGATGDVEIPISLKIGSVLISGNTINTTAGALNLNSFSDAIFAEDLTVSSLTSNGKTVMNAAQFVGVTAVTTATYNLLTTDYFLDVTRTATGACAITIPTAQIVTGRSFYIKDGGINAGTFNITFVGEGGELIDGLTSMVISGDGDGARITCISSSAMRIGG